MIENNVLDGQSFDETTKNNNLDVSILKNINTNKEDNEKKQIKNLPDKLFKKIYNLNSTKTPEVIIVDNKYYLAEIVRTEKKYKPFDDIEVQEALNAQLGFKNKIESNTSIVKDISMGGFDKEKLKNLQMKMN